MPAAPASRAAGREVTPVELFRLLPAHFAAVLVCTLLGGILAFAAARRAGVENISGDIMLALPHYTQAEFDETLELSEEGGATHISAYLLKIEPDSAFGRTPPEGLPTSDEEADFYLYAVVQLEQYGDRQYEISNFARPGYEGKHNLIYWDCGDYLGIGPAAHSCMGGKRFYYPADTEAFLRDEAAPVMDGGCGAEDYLILQLRLRKGLSLDEYKKRYGREFSTAQLAFVQNCVKSGYANFDGHTLALTPAGLIVQNSILAELLCHVSCDCIRTAENLESIQTESIGFILYIKFLKSEIFGQMRKSCKRCN